MKKPCPRGHTDEFLSTHSAKSLSAEKRVWFPSPARSLLSLVQWFLVVSFVHQQDRRTRVYLLMSAGRNGLTRLVVVETSLFGSDRLKPSISVRAAMIAAPAFSLCSVSLVQALFWLQHKSTFHHSGKYERSLWDRSETLNMKPALSSHCTVIMALACGLILRMTLVHRFRHDCDK